MRGRKSRVSNRGKNTSRRNTNRRKRSSRMKRSNRGENTIRRKRSSRTRQPRRVNKTSKRVNRSRKQRHQKRRKRKSLLSRGKRGGMLHESVEVSLDSLDSPDSLDIKQAWNAWRKSGKLRTTTTPPWNEPAIGNSKALKMDKVTQGDILQLRISSDNREPGAPRRVVDILTTVEYWGWEEETSEEGDNSWSLVIKCSRRRPLEAAAKVLVMGAEGARQAGPTGNKGRNKSSLEEYYLMADGVNIGHGNYRIQWTPWPKAPAMGDFTETW